MYNYVSHNIKYGNLQLYKYVYYRNIRIPDCTV